MFERRLKIFLVFLLLGTLVLVGRAFQVQVVQHAHWAGKAQDAMRQEQFVETTRGPLVDFRGRTIAEDRACIDACVDYAAIAKEPDPEWVRETARKRVRARRGDAWRVADAKGKAALLASEIALVRTDLDIMWETLARESRKSIHEIDEIRANVVFRVEVRRRVTWARRFDVARQEHSDRATSRPAPWYRRWIAGDDAPQMDQFDVRVKEQDEAHVILRNISAETRNRLWKHSERFPALRLTPSTTRFYDDADDACHLIGRMGRVLKEDVLNDPFIDEELKQYLPNDMKGRMGLEQLCEPLLRGKRGLTVRHVAKVDAEAPADIKPEPGTAVALSIDMDLQHEIASAFESTLVKEDPRDRETPPVPRAMLGACVVIDVPTGQVRAMVSVPGYRINSYDEDYPKLALDYLRRPLMNRATQFALEPGSTVKPIVGLAAINQNLFDVNHAIECTGYLPLAGRQKNIGRCWTMRMHNVGLHKIPYTAPHATGFLTFSDAIERSCNIYFETAADKLGEGGMRDWMDRFGLGRKTGIGVPEVEGTVPGDMIRAKADPSALWFSGIGQGDVTATPLQMANVAATIARGGIWVRPTLFANPAQALAIANHAGMTTPTRVDLRLSEASIAAAKLGMVSVVSKKAGTGTAPYRSDLGIGGKTGTAQATQLTYRERDVTGAPIRGADGKWPIIKVDPSLPGVPNPRAPWYRGAPNDKDGVDYAHSWYIAFAPADNPKIALAAMVEYGGSGGVAAGSIAKAAIEACIQNGYLAPDARGTPVAVLRNPAGDELLQDGR